MCMSLTITQTLDSPFNIEAPEVGLNDLQQLELHQGYHEQVHQVPRPGAPHPHLPPDTCRSSTSGSYLEYVVQFTPSTRSSVYTQYTQFSLHLEYVVQFTPCTRSSVYSQNTQFSLLSEHAVQFTSKTRSSVYTQYTEVSLHLEHVVQFTPRTSISVYIQNAKFSLNPEHIIQFTSRISS